MKNVEQIRKDGSVLLDKTEILKISQIKEVLSKHFQILNDRNPFEITFKGRRFYLCVKNVIYLGNTHPIHKKRIEVPGTWQGILKDPRNYLLGLYSYKGNNLFVLFDTTHYRKNKLNNSSAHVHTIDLVNAVRYGKFKKVDSRGNTIIVFTEAEIKKVFSNLLLGKEVPLTPELGIIDDFSQLVPSFWLGKVAYSEILVNKFADALQPEWPGFYFEYNFSKYLDAKPKRKLICTYVKNKKKGSLDFDLNFHNKFVGDLKMHDIKSSSVLGNKKDSINKVVNEDKRFWYVIMNHTTVMDKSRRSKLTKFWNQLLTKHRGKIKDPMSYSNKMKYSVSLVELMVAEVNNKNRQYLKEFRQGKQPGGEPRTLKVMINDKDLDNFVIYRKVI